MAWDSSRPVPWRRLIREWAVYVGIAIAAFVIYSLIRGRAMEVSLFVGLLASGPIYLLFGYITAKFGYQRKTYRELRNDRQVASAPQGSSSSSGGSAASRPKPPPTKRTSTGPSQNRKSTKPKRR